MRSNDRPRTIKDARSVVELIFSNTHLCVNDVDELQRSGKTVDSTLANLVSVGLKCFL